MKLRILVPVILGIVLMSSHVGRAQDPAKPTPPPVPLTVTAAWSDGTRQSFPPPKEGETPKPDLMGADTRLRDRIWIEVDRLVEAIQKDKINPRDLVLYINGQELKGIKAVAVDGPNQNWLGFDLLRTTDSNPIWRNILGSPKADFRLVAVSVGFPEKQAFPATAGRPQPAIYLRLFYWRWLIISLVALILIVLFFISFAKKGHLIHDSDPPEPPVGKMKPYSLALTQASWWFFWVIGSFVFIYMVTGDYNTVTDQALILMGIGTGTALGAFMINATKRNTADADLGTLLPAKAKLEAEILQLTGGTDAVTLAEKQAQLVELNKKIANAQAGLSTPTSEGFLDDLLSDVNGITLHRFQMLIWTIVLGIIFGIGVYRTLAMPDFNGTILALLGISAGTYLGFKIPERQN